MQEPTPEETRLNKHLALSLGVSRREADERIEQGRVLVDGKTAVLGQRITLPVTITSDGRPIDAHTDFTYLAFHKPAGYVCSRKDQGDVPTIYALIAPKYHKLKPVGRLDKYSSGLILLTNDGDFAFQMTHPKFSKTKVYEAILDHELEPLHQQMISDYGVQLEDGVSKLGLTRASDTNRLSWTITMSEGRNRQIRRTFAALGYEIRKLHRTQFGPYSLGDIPAGETKIVDMR